MTMADTPELPRGWEWKGGGRGKRHYTTNFGTEFRMGGALAGKHGLGGYDGQVYWDEKVTDPQEHHVVIYSIEGIDSDGDLRMGYPVISRTYDSEQEALDAVPDLIESLNGE